MIFVRDSFGEDGDEQLNEIQYGDQTIIIEGSLSAYVAAVIDGVEPSGFRQRLRDFVSELNLQHERRLRHFDGDPSILPNMDAEASRFYTSTTDAKSDQLFLQKTGTRLLWGLGIAGTLLTLFSCFYLIFTIRLLPSAFPALQKPTVTPTSMPSTTIPTPTTSPMAIPSITPTNTATNTPTASPTSSPTPTHTPTLTPIGYTYCNPHSRFPTSYSQRQCLVSSYTRIRCGTVFGNSSWDIPEGFLCI